MSIDKKGVFSFNLSQAGMILSLWTTTLLSLILFVCFLSQKKIFCEEKGAEKTNEAISDSSVFLYTPLIDEKRLAPQKKHQRKLVLPAFILEKTFAGERKPFLNVRRTTNPKKIANDRQKPQPYTKLLMDEYKLYPSSTHNDKIREGEE